ncbi:major histocompatibility complex class I-related gene protein-like [Halichoeres trimaculatus]|uniref:major histocompatibility complex class I-related gene protein-like n=1 Tax=Halichoeres trimaculatus TaxID=147232 RepID=UPI003D9E2BC7
MLLLFCHAVVAVKHTMTLLITESSGLRDFPEFVSTTMIDKIQLGYYDSNTEEAKPTHDLAKLFIENNPGELELYTLNCLASSHVFKVKIGKLKKVFKQSEGVHILQRSYGCGWDDESEETDGFDRYGYDGEDLVTLDLKTMTWTVPKLHMTPSALGWKTDKAEISQRMYYTNSICLGLLKQCLNLVRFYLQRTDLPSVSLLQKSPSSPVSCFATGFFPDRAVIFWRKDGEELFEDVDHGDLLPNHDGSFQMSVDLNISLVKTEDWRRYECVFQLSGVKEDIVTKLEKTAIRSNHGSEFPAGRVTGVIVGLLLLSVCIAGLFIWRKNNNGFQLAHRDQGALEVDAEL